MSSELWRTYYLTLVEELSITKAASRLFITQQALSDCIRRMEAHYGTKLFERRPRLKLTQAGEIVADRYREMDLLEDALSSELAELNREDTGEVRLGMNHARARILAPGLVSRYRALYPNVTLTIAHEETSNLERMLRSGELDLFMGVNIASADDLFPEVMLQEETLVAASRSLLLGCFPDLDARLPGWQKRGVDLHEWAGTVPFLLNPPISRLRTQLDAFFAREQIVIRPFLTISDNETQMLISAKDAGACFVPKMFANFHGEEINRTQPEDPLYTFRIRKLQETGFLELVRLKARYVPRYMQAMTDLVQELTSSFL